MRAIQFHAFGDPADVLRLEQVEQPHPGPGEIRVAVHAVGLNPADWALVAGLFAERLPPLPRGVGLDVSGTIDEVGEGVTDVAPGSQVFGPATFNGPSAGAADHAVLSHWAHVPDGLDQLDAATLPMATATAWSGLDALGVTAGETLLVHGAGSVIGEAAVSLALRRGVRVIATAGPNRTPTLTQLGAAVTTYGDGMTDRVRAIAGSTVDRALDASPVGGSLPALVELTGDPDRVLTLSDFAAAEELGARVNTTLRYDTLPEVAQLAANGAFTVPIARTFTLEQFPEAVALSRSAHAGGKVLLLVSAQALASAETPYER